MAEAHGDKVSSLAEQYLLPGREEKTDEVKVVDPVKAVTEEVKEKVAEASDSVAEVASSAVEAASDTVASSASTENTEEVAAAATPASEETEGTNEENSSADETPEIKLETAPADFRFPTTNQTRHCFTRYIEYHRCIAAKGEDAQECQKFAKYYRALCPGEWVDRWNEQRENNTFPGPL